MRQVCKPDSSTKMTKPLIGPGSIFDFCIDTCKTFSLHILHSQYSKFWCSSSLYERPMPRDSKPHMQCKCLNAFIRKKTFINHPIAFTWQAAVSLSKSFRKNLENWPLSPCQDHLTHSSTIYYLLNDTCCWSSFSCQSHGGEKHDITNLSLSESEYRSMKATEPRRFSEGNRRDWRLTSCFFFWGSGGN